MHLSPDGFATILTISRLNFLNIDHFVYGEVLYITGVETHCNEGTLFLGERTMLSLLKKAWD